MFDNIYKGKRVLITGHTGFKGSWLCLAIRPRGNRCRLLGGCPDRTVSF